MTAEEKRNLQCYRRYIERSLNPVYILSNMTEWLSDGESRQRRCPAPAAPGPSRCPHCLSSAGFSLDVKERVRKEEEKGVTAAAALFLDAVLLLEAEGWLRGFLDALVAAGECPPGGLCPPLPGLARPPCGSWHSRPARPAPAGALPGPWLSRPSCQSRSDAVGKGKLTESGNKPVRK